MYSYNILSLPGPSFTESLGLTFSLSSLVTTFLLMMIFYLGPVVVQITLFILDVLYDVESNGQLRPLPAGVSIFSSLHRTLRSEYFSVCDFIGLYGTATFRNLFFAPVTEELIFRTIIVPIMFSYYCVSRGVLTPFQVALYSPSWFSLAHAHHVYDKLRLGLPAFQVLAQTLLQLTYTSIFGVIAALLLMRTNSISGPILSHIICNFYGLPNLDFLIPPRRPQSRRLSCLYPYRVIILIIHAAGLILFGYFLFPFTERYANQSPLWQVVRNNKLAS